MFFNKKLVINVQFFLFLSKFMFVTYDARGPGFESSH